MKCLLIMMIFILPMVSTHPLKGNLSIESLSSGELTLFLKNKAIANEKIVLHINIEDTNFQSVGDSDIVRTNKFYHYSVDWGDGSSLTSLSSKREIKVYHRYEKTGIFTIRVKVYSRDKSVMKEALATVEVVEAEEDSSSISKDLHVKVKIVSPKKEEIRAGDKISIRIDVSKQGGNNKEGLDKSGTSRTRGSFFIRILEILRDIFNRKRPSSKISALFADRERSVEKINLYRYSISWGDGEKKTVIGGKSLTVTHIYANSGEYRFRVEVKDLSTNEKASASLRIFINDKIPLCNDDEPDQSQEKRDDYILFWDGIYLAQDFVPIDDQGNFPTIDEITKIEIYVGRGLALNENITLNASSLSSGETSPITSSSLVVRVEIPFAGVSRTKEISGNNISRKGGWISVDFSDDPIVNYAFPFSSKYRCRIVLIPKGGYFRWYYGKGNPYPYGEALISTDGEEWERLTDREGKSLIDFCFRVYGRNWDESPDGIKHYYAILWAGPLAPTGKCRTYYNANRLRSTLVNHGWNYSDITIIRDEHGEMSIEKFASFVITMRELDKIENKDDVFIFYYAGHGYYIGGPLSSINMYLNTLASAQCIILDCCSSGSYGSKVNGDRRVILMSSEAGKPSYCSLSIGFIFTTAIIEAINGESINGKPINGGKGYKTAEDIFYEYARDRTIELSRGGSDAYEPQVPQIIDNYSGKLQIIPQNL